MTAGDHQAGSGDQNARDVDALPLPAVGRHRQAFGQRRQLAHPYELGAGPRLQG
ncbi:hypothetical protein [Nonomuraea longispora]|uniref:hypothetical protein n=1 Tax=Nonomuraea longispora TaxID=1848320 RepID=UPI001405575B|nr:hypothetical protein [Nonomuraea longispora]